MSWFLFTSTQLIISFYYCRDWEGIKSFKDTTRDRTPTSELAKGAIDVYMINARIGMSEAERLEIVAWVKQGGGLIVAGEAWAWETGKPGKT